MIIILSGYPQSGKSVVADMMQSELDCIVISPENYHMDVPESKKKDMHLHAWQLSEEELFETMSKRQKDGNKEIIIYDTCGSNKDQLRSIYNRADETGHEKVFLFVKAKISSIINWSDKEYLNKEMFKKYRGRFKDILPIMKKNSDEFIVVDNTSGFDSMRECVLEKIDGKFRIYKS